MAKAKQQAVLPCKENAANAKLMLAMLSVFLPEFETSWAYQTYDAIYQFLDAAQRKLPSRQSFSKRRNGPT